MRRVHPIELESYRILNARVDLSALAPLTRAVTERVVHASADLDYVQDLRCSEASLEAGIDALMAGRPVITDVEMVAAGITRRHRVSDVICRITDPRAPALAAELGITRSAAAARLAHDEAGPGAVWVIGCAPTALFEVLALDCAPALVIGLPVGFVGAAESKAALRAAGLPSLSNVSERGGSAVASAALNALIYSDRMGSGPGDSTDEENR